MSDEKVYLTDEGFLELETELNELKNVKRPAVIKALKEARALGDLSENADYDAARSEQAQVEGRIQELEKIMRVVRREGDGCDIEVLLTLDASTGQNGIRQAEEFQQATDLTGVVLTKLDGTAKGGVIAAIRHKLGLPIRYVGVGEQLDDLQPFLPEEFVNALFEETE